MTGILFGDYTYLMTTFALAKHLHITTTIISITTFFFRLPLQKTILSFPHQPQGLLQKIPYISDAFPDKSGEIPTYHLLCVSFRTSLSNLVKNPTPIPSPSEEGNTCAYRTTKAAIFFQSSKKEKTPGHHDDHTVPPYIIGLGDLALYTALTLRPYHVTQRIDTMASPPSWRPLPVPAPHGVPALLVSTAFATDSYTVRVTDLANMWAEVMDRRAIYRRSLDEDTTIDPTDSPQNMQAFLSRVRSAFDPSHEDHADSRLTLSVDHQPGDHVLVLNMTCNLPGLDPLRWPMVLHRCPPSQLATELVLPLIQANLTRVQQVNSLLEIIHQKDAVMGRLLDKLEATGTRLEHIFPALSAKQQVSRSTAEQKIRGLAPFKREEWDDQQAAGDELPKDVPSLTEAVFGETGLAYHSGMDICDSPALDDWWTKLGNTSNIPIIEPRQGNARAKNETPPPQIKKMAHHAGDDDDSSDDDDEDDFFETQATPPPRPSARKRAEDQRTMVGDDDSTVDEDGPSPSAELANEAKGKNRPPARLGTIGKTKHPSPTPRRPSTPAGDGSETESGSDKEGPPLSGSTRNHPPPPSSLTGTTPKKRGGLGRIGGTKRPDPAPSSSAEEATAPSAAEKLTPRKLGKIGSKPPAGNPPVEDGSVDSQTRGRTAERQPEPGPRARETTQKGTGEESRGRPGTKEAQILGPMDSSTPRPTSSIYATSQPSDCVPVTLNYAVWDDASVAEDLMDLQARPTYI
ncbi:hypothetical protein ACRALDRAFT_1092757 [Sodiomyces alcalophilus JCM 7366]|uniref:uncharacterized protein n=1 Tax=Sodiomyces alcalophilus JCM 7366 TaxID=591952 RepID=UPI0039B3F10B